MSTRLQNGGNMPAETGSGTCCGAELDDGGETGTEVQEKQEKQVSCTLEERTDRHTHHPRSNSSQSCHAEMGSRTTPRVSQASFDGLFRSRTFLCATSSFPGKVS